MAKKRRLNLKYDGHDTRARQQYFQHVTGHQQDDLHDAFKLLNHNRRFNELIGSKQWIELSDITTLVALMRKQNKEPREIVDYLKQNEWI